MQDVIKFEDKLTMTLKEITDLLDVRHNNAMITVDLMRKNESFGNVTEIQYRTSKGNEYKTYSLDKRRDKPDQTSAVTY